jgi:hypothetical protein
LPDATLSAAQRAPTTLYSVLWLDVASEPLSITIPEARERFRTFSLLDHCSEGFASPDARTMGGDSMGSASLRFVNQRRSIHRPIHRTAAQRPIQY